MKFVRDFNNSTVRNVKSFDKLIGLVNKINTSNTHTIDILNEWASRKNISKDFIDCCISVMIDTSTINAENMRKYGILYLRGVNEYKRLNLMHYTNIGLVTKEQFNSVDKILEKISIRYNKRLMHISTQELTNFSIACEELNKQDN